MLRKRFQIEGYAVTINIYCFKCNNDCLVLLSLKYEFLSNRCIILWLKIDLDCSFIADELAITYIEAYFIFSVVVVIWKVKQHSSLLPKESVFWKFGEIKFNFFAIAVTILELYNEEFVFS